MSIAVVVNYFNNEKSLVSLIENFKMINRVKPGIFEFILVDDHSHEIVSVDVFADVANLKVFRVSEDVTWNMPGARNIGALEAHSKQILFMDVDHLIDEAELDQLLVDSENLTVGKRLTPGRKIASGDNVGKVVKPNINCFLIHRSDFFRVGGYEESFSGSYGQEDKYFRYCCKWNNVEDVLGESVLSVVPGASTKEFDRDKTRNEIIIESLIFRRIIKAAKAFTYEYTQIA